MTVNVRRLLFVRALRAFGDGYVSLLLPVYLLSLGLTPFEVGVIATATLLGSGALTLWVGLHAYRFRYRALLFAAAVLMTATGLGFATFTAFQLEADGVLARCAVQSRRVRRRLHRSVVAGVVVASEVSIVDRRRRNDLLLDRSLLRAVVFGGDAHRRSIRPRQHHGLHAFA